MENPVSSHPQFPSAPPPRSRRWRRFFTIVGALAAALLLLVALLPTLISGAKLRGFLEESLSKALGTRVEIRDFSLGWTTGVRLSGLTVAQPEGFPAERPLLTVGDAGLSIAWLDLMRERIDVAGQLRGVRVLVFQRKDGSVNIERLGGRVRVDSDSEGRIETRRNDGPGSVSAEMKATLANLRVDLAMRDVTIEVVDEERGVLERIQRLEGTIDKRFGGSDFKVQFSAELAGPDASRPPGRLQVDADVDGTLERPLEVQMTSAGFDLARYRPLIDAALGQGALAACDGVIDGTVKARVENLETVFVTGALTVSEPRLAGTLVHGMDLRAKKWVVNPNLKLTGPKAGAPAQADFGGFALDLGLARIRGVPSAEAAQALSGKDAVAFDFEVDLQALGRLGGPIPAQLAAQPGALTGRATVAVPAGGLTAIDAAKLVTEALSVAARIDVPKLVVGSSTSLGALALETSLAGGKARAKLLPGGTLNGGAFQLDVAADLAQPSWPTTLSLGIDDAQLAGEAVQLLQYAVPLFAGLAGQQHVQLDGRGTLAVQLTGPANTAGESWLRWLDRWSGAGKVELAQGSVTPAAAFAGLAQMFDPQGGGRIAFDALGTDFTLKFGAVETGLMKLDGKAKKIQVTGRTTLDGRIDHRVDLLGLLAGHKDGDKVLAFLKDRPLAASIAGTLASPQVALPDLQKVITEALEAEAKRQAQDLIQKGLQDLLKRRGG